MRKLIRQYLSVVLAVYILAKVTGGISYNDNLKVLLASALILSLINLTVKPIVNLVSIPINILTLGLFSFVIDGFMLYLVTRVYSDFRIGSFYVSSIDLGVLSNKKIYISHLASYIVIAFLISCVRNIVNWLCSK